MKMNVLTVIVLMASTALAVTTPERAAVARRCAAESIVLLKNDGVLPLKADARVDVVPQVGTPYMGCGRGSAWVWIPYEIDIPTGLRNAGVSVDPANRDVALWTITRDATEGVECRDFGDYCLSAAERSKLAELKAAGYRKIVVVLNVGTMISMKELAEDEAVSALLYVSFPGLEGGNAIADVLSGLVNPSGRLPVTVAEKLSDYPSDATWQEARHYVPYEEDIFLGYRYFCTIPGAAEKVTYPFGYGLSSTTFELSDLSVSRGHSDRDMVTAKVRVTNTGRRAGRHSVLLYTSVAGGRAEHPSKELRAFAKTRLLEPGASEPLELTFDVDVLAYFDDMGVSGRIGSWVVDGGEYTVWAGGSPFDAVKVGSFGLEQRIVATPGFKLNPARLARRLHADGTFSEEPVLYGDRNGRRLPVDWPKERPAADRIITLQQVAKGERTLDEFVDQMPVEDVLELLHGQPNVIAIGNTCSVGVLKEYGVTGLQTADGPVGIRLGQKPKEGGKPTPEQLATSFPATALTAGSFDIALQEEYGRVLGAEAAAVGIDIHLAPGVCLARHPMCGRNFEYMGEDPYLTGRMAAAYIRGVQSQGVASTIKHFAGNNRENTRRESWDVVSERAMREIYLRGFEIAVREAQPKCLMTSYNGINGVLSGANFGLIEGILRGEWGYRGLVMTDWHALSSIWENIAAGNDVKMPEIANSGYYASATTQKEIAAHIAHRLREGVVDSRRVKASAKRVLELVMQSPRFAATLKAQQDE